MQKGNIVFFLTLLSGLIIGGFIGDALGRFRYFAWLNYGKEIGLTSPLFLDLSFMSLTFGLTLKLTLAGIIGMVIAIILYKKL